MTRMMCASAILAAAHHTTAWGARKVGPSGRAQHMGAYLVNHIDSTCWILTGSSSWTAWYHCCYAIEHPQPLKIDPDSSLL